MLAAGSVIKNPAAWAGFVVELVEDSVIAAGVAGGAHARNLSFPARGPAPGNRGVPLISRGATGKSERDECGNAERKDDFAVHGWFQIEKGGPVRGSGVLGEKGKKPGRSLPYSLSALGRAYML